MKRIAALCLATALVLGGCPGGAEVPSAVTILTAGTYTGTVACTITVTDSTGTQVEETESPGTVEITETGQLFLNDIPYYDGVTYEDNDAQQGVVSTLTINDISESGDTVVISGSGTTSQGNRAYNTTREITLVQASDTQIQIADVFAGQVADGPSFEVDCSGTLSR